MIGVLLLAATLGLGAPDVAQEANITSAPVAPPTVDPDCPPEHAAMGHCTPVAGKPPAPVKVGPPAGALSGPDNAADAVWGADAMEPVRRGVYAENGGFIGWRILLDRLEYRGGRDGRNGYVWDGEGWYGGDYDRLWIKSQGEGGFGQPIAKAEVQALWSRPIDPWFNLQAGLRYDIRPRPNRAHLVLGVQGLAPYLFEVDAAAFISDRGELTGRLEAEYDQRITNRLILQPRVEFDLAAQDIRALDIGAGLSSVETGARLRYEFVPEFAPYVGVAYEHSIGRTADLVRAAGKDGGGWNIVAGVRAWF